MKPTPFFTVHPSRTAIRRSTFTAKSWKDNLAHNITNNQSSTIISSTFNGSKTSSGIVDQNVKFLRQNASTTSYWLCAIVVLLFFILYALLRRKKKPSLKIVPETQFYEDVSSAEKGAFALDSIRVDVNSQLRRRSAGNSPK